MKELTFSAILDAVYDAATAADRWPAALECIGRAFGCGYVGLIDRNPRTMEGRATAIGIDPAGQRDYFTFWSKGDVVRDMIQQRTRVYRTGAVETDQDILPRSELLGSDYYNGFMKPHDMHAFLRITLAADGDLRQIVSMTRPRALGDFEAADIEGCRRILPHLQRAAHVGRRVESAQVMLAALSDVLEHGATGVVLLDRCGKVWFANRAVRAMARAGDGVLLRCERVEAVNRRDDAALQRLIAGAAGRRGPEAARGGVLSLSRTLGRPDLAVVAAPLASHTPLTRAGPAAFLLVTDPDVMAARPEAQLRQQFGLGGAEARLAERLMAGETAEQAAAMLGIKISTARWHIASLFRKTRTSRQAQLVRALLSAPTM